MVARNIYSFATEGDRVYFQVETTNVRVCSRGVFMMSKHFYNPLSSGEGDSAEDPIDIDDDVTIGEFDYFAWALHADYVALEADARSLNSQKWTAIYGLAVKWDFPLLAHLANTKLRKLSSNKAPVEMGSSVSRGVTGMVDDPVGGVTNILGGIGQGIGTLVGGAVVLPFAIASTPFIGIHKAIQKARE